AADDLVYAWNASRDRMHLCKISEIATIPDLNDPDAARRLVAIFKSLASVRVVAFKQQHASQRAYHLLAGDILRTELAKIDKPEVLHLHQMLSMEDPSHKDKKSIFYTFMWATLVTWRNQFKLKVGDEKDGHASSVTTESTTATGKRTRSTKDEKKVTKTGPATKKQKK
ncbi:hypothetical protein HDU98_002816, partial [Podochytrium sp. JEL0797]